MGKLSDFNPNYVLSINCDSNFGTDINAFVNLFLHEKVRVNGEYNKGEREN